jgi:hypothetical protein
MLYLLFHWFYILDCYLSRFILFIRYFFSSSYFFYLANCVDTYFYFVGYLLKFNSFNIYNRLDVELVNYYNRSNKTIQYQQNIILNFSIIVFEIK